MDTESQDSSKNDTELWWKLKSLQLDIFSKLFSIVSVITGISLALIAYANYVGQKKENETNESLIELHSTVDITPISKNQSLATIAIDLSNKGKFPIYPYAHSDDCENGVTHYQGEGLTLSLTKHPIPQGNVAISMKTSDEERVIERYNILKERYDYSKDNTWDRNYVIRPNGVYTEAEALVVQRKTLYEVRVRFHAFRRDAEGNPKTWTNTETKYFYVN